MFFSMHALNRHRLWFVILLSLVFALPVMAFDKSDLATVTKKTVFYERSNYAVGVSRVIEDSKAKPGTTELTVYYVSKNCYDPIFSIPFGFPAELEQTQEAVTFRQGAACLTLKADGIRYTFERVFTSDTSSSP